jgi:hypothetical protein
MQYWLQYLRSKARSCGQTTSTNDDGVRRGEARVGVAAGHGGAAVDVAEGAARLLALWQVRRPPPRDDRHLQWAVCHQCVDARSTQRHIGWHCRHHAGIRQLVCVGTLFAAGCGQHRAVQRRHTWLPGGAKSARPSVRSRMLPGQPITTMLLPRPQVWWPVSSATAATDCCTSQSCRNIGRDSSRVV